MSLRTKLPGRIPASMSGPVRIRKADGTVTEQPPASRRALVKLANEDEERDGGEMARARPGMSVQNVGREKR